VTVVLNWTAEVVPRVGHTDDDDYDYEAVVVFVNGHEVGSTLPTDYFPYSGTDSDISIAAANVIERLLQ